MRVSTSPLDAAEQVGRIRVRPACLRVIRTAKVRLKSASPRRGECTASPERDPMALLLLIQSVGGHAEVTGWRVAPAS